MIRGRLKKMSSIFVFDLYFVLIASLDLNENFVIKTHQFLIGKSMVSAFQVIQLVKD